MKKILLVMFLFFAVNTNLLAKELNYRQIYMDLPVPNFAYMHGIDPGQYYDNQYATYSVYPLFRLSSPLYFKTVTILPGYYDLTPRKHKGDYYMFFKQNGAIRYIVPVFKRELVPQGFYEAHLPKPKLTWTQRISKNWYSFVGKHFKSAKRKPPVKTYLEIDDIDNKFVIITVYYDDYRYYSIFRTVQM